MSFYSIDVEKALIASLMSIEDAFDRIASKVDIDDFVAGKHQVLFTAIKDLSKQGLPYDSVMVHDWLEANGHSKEVTDSYLAEILSESPATLFNLSAYADTTRNYSRLRAADKLLVDARERLSQADVRLDDKINRIIEGLSGVIDSGNTSGGGARTIGSMMPEFFDNLRASSKGEITPFRPTGFYELDNNSPIQNGDLVVVGGRPSMGKTTLAQSMVQNMVKDDFYIDANGNRKRRAGVFFSLEMTDESVTQRFMASMSGVELHTIRSGMGLKTDDWANLMTSAADYGQNDGNDYPMVVDSRNNLTYNEMRTELNRVRNRHGEIGVIMVDFLQIMGGLDGKDRIGALGEATRNLKAFGKEFNCPVILLSQLNRSLESRPNKRPIMSDLRESGEIEQAADVIMFLYRDEVYNEKSEAKGIAEVIIAKNRQGKVGTVRLGFEGHYSRFTNYMPAMHDLDKVPDYGSR